MFMSDYVEMLCFEKIMVPNGFKQLKQQQQQNA